MPSGCTAALHPVATQQVLPSIGTAVGPTTSRDPERSGWIAGAGPSVMAATRTDTNADADTDVCTFATKGDDVSLTPFATRDDIVNHMELLTSDAHPGHALAALQIATDQDESSVVIVTSPDALADPNFRQCLDDAAFLECYIASVARSGEFELSLRRAGGSKPIARLQLDLESILEPPAQTQRPRTLERKDVYPHLPVLLSVNEDGIDERVIFFDICPQYKRAHFYAVF